jgi:threonine-phosphate decarboxylase
MIINNDYGHGGDVYKNKVKYDFSANVNPYGAPDAVRAAIVEAAAEIERYPDPYCGKLRESLSLHLNTPMGNIVCGNGAAELIFQFVTALKPEKTLLPVPAFSEYEIALNAMGCDVTHFSLRREDKFELKEDILPHINSEVSLLMLCNPNNPTGQCIKPELLLKILERCRETGTWLFIDECFIDFVEKGKSVSLVPRLRENDRAFVLRAFTKLYGMAGVRLGYAVCREKKILTEMCSKVQPWNVSNLAQTAGVAALECGDWVKETMRKIREEKRFLVKELSALNMNIFAGEANYLMVFDEPGLYKKLLERGILIRNCNNYHGLKEGDCRIAVRTREENEALIKALRELKNA